jgi:hypothetical protein
MAVNVTRSDEETRSEMLLKGPIVLLVTENKAIRSSSRPTINILHSSSEAYKFSMTPNYINFARKTSSSVYILVYVSIKEK